MKELAYQGLADSLPFVENGKKLLWFGFYMTVYFEDGHLLERRQAVLEVFEEYWSWCNEQLKWVTHPETHIWQRIASSVLPDKWLLQQTEEKHVWDFCYHGGDTFDECSPFRIQGLGIPSRAPYYDLSFFNVSFPVTWFAEHQDEDAPSLIRRWCGILKPLHGSAGLAILTSLDTKQESRMATHVRGLAKRFPWLEVDYPISHGLYLQQGIKSVNWLNLLEERWIVKLGGLETLRKQLGEDLIIYGYPSGLLIQAGPYPQVGDTNRKIGVEPYRKLSAILRPIRADYQAPFLGFDLESTQEWFNRFD